jgi:hypothetical protein
VTDHVGGFVVVLEKDIREDDAEATVEAIKQLRGVLTVKPVESGVGAIIARAQARGEIVARLWKALEGWS